MCHKSFAALFHFICEIMLQLNNSFLKQILLAVELMAISKDVYLNVNMYHFTAQCCSI